MKFKLKAISDASFKFIFNNLKKEKELLNLLRKYNSQTYVFHKKFRNLNEEPIDFLPI